MKTINKKTFTNITKRVWEKNASLNTEAIKAAARRRVGDIMNNHLADLIIQNIEMPKWLALIGGRKFLRPIVKIFVANSGIFALGFIESQGYKSSKAEFVVEAMLEAGYDDFVGLVNVDNIGNVIDKFIEIIPLNLFNDAGFDIKTNQNIDDANSILKKAGSIIPSDD